jgi:hypothetical protein
VEDREAGAQLVGEAEEVQVRAELAVVAAGGLLEQLQVRLERVAGRPHRPVHPLELGVLLRAAPVRGGRAHQLERADQPGAGQMRAAAQVGPADLAGLAVDVVVDGQFRVRTAADLHHLGGVEALALDVDQFEFERLVGQFGLGLVQVAEAAPAEPLAGLDDLLHPLLELREVIGLERLRDVEVVVEAALDRRTDAELRLGERVLHGLGQHVGGRVPQHHEPVGLVERHRGHAGLVPRRPVEVAQVALGVTNDHDRLRAAGRQAGGGDRVSRRRTGRHDDGVVRGSCTGCGHGDSFGSFCGPVEINLRSGRRSVGGASGPDFSRCREQGPQVRFLP